jgi:hypothetical protein
MYPNFEPQQAGAARLRDTVLVYTSKPELCLQAHADSASNEVETEHTVRIAEE